MVVIPLRYRIPNVSPSHALEGALDDVSEQGPLMCFVGEPREVRESVLVWQEQVLTVEQRRSHVVYLHIDEHISGRDFYSHIIDIFENISRASDTEHHRPEGDMEEEAQLAWLIDFADLHQLKVIVEGVHRVDMDTLKAFASSVKRYACSALWFLMGDGSLQDVVDPACVVRVGEVSPRVLASQDPLQMPLRSESQRFSAQGVASVFELSESQQRAISVLSTVEYAVLSSFLLDAFELTESDLRELQDKGVIQVTPTGVVLSTDVGVRLHRELGVSSTVLEQRVHRVLDVMMQAQGDNHVDVQFSALKCAAYHTLLPRIEEILEDCFELFRRQGYLSELYVIIDDLKEPRLQVWLFRVSCYMADFEKAEALRWQEELDLEDSMYWLYLLLMKGKYEALQKQGNVLLEQHEYDEMKTKDKMFCDQIRILVARSYIQTAEFQKALDTLDPTSTEDQWMSLRTKAVRIKALAYSNRVQEGRALLLDVITMFDSLQYAEQSYWAIVVVQSYYILKQYREAARVARRFFGASNALRSLRGTAPIMLGALWSDTGNEELAERCITLARYSFQNATAMFAMVCNIDLSNVIARGDVERITECLEQFKGVREENVAALTRVEHHIMKVMAWVHYGRRLDPQYKPQMDYNSSEQGESHMAQSIWEMWAYLYESKQISSQDVTMELVAGEEENYLFEIIARAVGLAIQGVEFTDELSAAIATARHFAMYRVGQEVCQLYCIHSFLFMPSRFGQSIDFLEEFVGVTGAKRFVEELKLWRLLKSKKTMEIQELEDLFEQVQHSSLAYTMLSTMLGDLPVEDLNALEHVLFTRISEIQEEQSVVVLPDMQEQGASSVDTPLWSVHMNTGQVWVLTKTSPEVVLDPESIPFHLLKYLLKNPGEVDKEELITRTWDDVSEYHPLMHDNRLRLAIRKLRKQLRDELGDLPFIATTKNGYSIGCPVRMIEKK